MFEMGCRGPEKCSQVKDATAVAASLRPPIIQGLCRYGIGGEKPPLEGSVQGRGARSKAICNDTADHGIRWSEKEDRTLR